MVMCQGLLKSRIKCRRSVFLTCALMMRSVGLWLQGSGCIEEQLFHMREINAILGSCQVQMALVLLRCRSGGLGVLLFGLDSSGFGRSCFCTVLRNVSGSAAEKTKLVVHMALTFLRC